MSNINKDIGSKVSIPKLQLIWILDQQFNCDAKAHIQTKYSDTLVEPKVGDFLVSIVEWNFSVRTASFTLNVNKQRCSSMLYFLLVVTLLKCSGTTQPHSAATAMRVWTLQRVIFRTSQPLWQSRWCLIYL